MTLKKELKSVTIETIGLSQRELLTLFLLHELQQGKNYPKSLHETLKSKFPGKVHSYDYLCKIAKQLALNGDLILTAESGKNYYSTTQKGKELYSWYQNSFKERLFEVKKVIDRFAVDLTGSGTTTPVEYPLPKDYRNYFSKIVSVKDLVRYTTLKMASERYNFYMGEVSELLERKFGWIASNGYLYDISTEMEKDHLLVGKWEGEKRSKRFLRITEEGSYHYKQIADSAAHRIKDLQHYLSQVINIL